MAQFTVRIELHEANWSDYQSLHVEMERVGFSRTITADDGKVYQMPWAEYDGTGNLSSMQILNIAQTAANRTGKRNSIFVTEAKSRAWCGLPAA